LIAAWFGIVIFRIKKNNVFDPVTISCLREDGSINCEDVSFLTETSPGVLVYASFFHKHENISRHIEETCFLSDIDIYPYKTEQDKALFLEYVQKDITMKNRHYAPRSKASPITSPTVKM